jgi:hypothetical protein
MAVEHGSPAADIVEIVSLADLLDHHLVGRNGLDTELFAAQHRAMWTAPTAAAAGAYLVWHNAYFSMSEDERRWLARAVGEDLHTVDPDSAR